MSRLVIAIDCDDVLVPGTEFSVATYNRLWGTSVTLPRAHELSNDEWDAPREEVARRFDEMYLSEEYATMKPYPEAIAAVRRLAHKYELHVVTARPETIMEVTARMIQLYFPDCFASMQHVGFNGNKGGICEALKADVLIDDNFRHLASAKDCGVATRIWFGNYPWQTEKPEPGTVTARCLDWTSTEAEIARSTA